MTTTSPTLTTSMHSPTPGSELAHARQHLREVQANLTWLRALTPHGSAEAIAEGRPLILNAAKSQVLAALSWVWDAQERAREEGERPFFDYVSAQIKQTTDGFLDRLARSLRRQPPKMKAKRSRARAKAA